MSKRTEAMFEEILGITQFLRKKIEAKETSTAANIMPTLERLIAVYEKMVQVEATGKQQKECTLPHYPCTRQHYPYGGWTWTTNTSGLGETYGSVTDLSGKVVFNKPDDGQDTLPGMEETG